MSRLCGELREQAELLKSMRSEYPMLCWARRSRCTEGGPELSAGVPGRGPLVSRTRPLMRLAGLAYRGPAEMAELASATIAPCRWLVSTLA